MSLLSPVTSVVSPGKSGATPGVPNANANDNANSTEEPVQSTDSGTTSAETTQTNQQVAPVTASRSTNASSTARSGGEGSTAIDEQARLDAAFGKDLTEAQARRYAEETQRKLIQKEILSKIPVPVEAIPKLGNDVESVRSLGTEAAPGFDQSA